MELRAANAALNVKVDSLQDSLQERQQQQQQPALTTDKPIGLMAMLQVKIFTVTSMSIVAKTWHHILMPCHQRFMHVSSLSYTCCQLCLGIDKHASKSGRQ